MSGQGLVIFSFFTELQIILALPKVMSEERPRQLSAPSCPQSHLCCCYVFIRPSRTWPRAGLQPPLIRPRFQLGGKHVTRQSDLPGSFC
ncbi:hypothetical protein B0H67DRAFT_582816 [Lasiosphaeris hirsuta]|uniref:Secreted protein n=1 Tax=Lasiosphaeris hirsuta TaxID=260670 RepID=A0AA40DUR1_9PEZI|nr:hypothetical protein B0H67DRAFT_582816 [Lasiosphaeris hirsuta]